MRPSLLLTVWLVGCGDMGLAALPDPVVSGEADPAVIGSDDPAADDGGAENDAAIELDLSERLYAITADNVTVVDPPGLDGMKAQFLDRDLLVYVEDAGADEITMDLARADAEGRQDRCERVVNLPDGEWQNPTFDVGPGELTTSFAGNPATFQSLRMNGTFDADGEAWEGTFSAVLDARELAPALPEVDDVCELVAALGGMCTPCNDGDVSCFALVLDDVLGERASGAFDPTPTCD